MTTASGEEIEMFEFGMFVLAVVGAVWLFGALIVGVLKLTFGLLGAIFGGLFGLFALGIAALLIVPIVFLAMLPLLMPVLCTVALVWFIVHASRAHHASPRPAQDGARTG